MGSPFLTALDLTKRRMKLISLGSVALAWSAVSLLVLLSFVIWDHWRSGGIPGWAAISLRMGYLAATIAWLIVAVVLPSIRHISDVYAARLLERGHPEYGNVLVGAVQLIGREELPGSVRVALVKQASRRLGHTDVRRSVPRSGLRRWAVVLLAVLTSFGGYWVVAPKSVLVSVRRALGAHLPPPTRTILEAIEPAGGLRVLRGRDVLFRVQLGGQRPPSAAVQFSMDGGRTWPVGQRMKLSRLGSGHEYWGTRAGPDVQASMSWQVLAGDASSEIRDLVVLPEPAIVDMEVRYTYPAYTRLPPATQPGGDINALVGTRAVIVAHTNVPARQPVLVAGEGGEERRRILAEPTGAASGVITAEWIVYEDSSYSLLFHDQDGNTNPVVRQSVHAQPDLVPTVDWQGDPGPSIFMPSEPIAIRARAEDDFGITRAVLACRRTSDRAVREIPLTTRFVTSNECTVQGSVVDARLGLRPGDSADLWVTVWDNREDLQGQPANQRADSPLRRITIQRPLASAPAVARVDQPKSRPSPAGQTQRAENVAGKTDVPETQEARAPHGTGEKRTLQQFVTEHEKELALLEHKLNSEMRNEPGGREEGSVPDVIPAAGSAAQAGKGEGKQGENANPAGVGNQASSDSKSDGMQGKATASQPAGAGQAKSTSGKSEEAGLGDGAAPGQASGHTSTRPAQQQAKESGESTQAAGDQKVAGTQAAGGSVGGSADDRKQGDPPEQRSSTGAKGGPQSKPDEQGESASASERRSASSQESSSPAGRPSPAQTADASAGNTPQDDTGPKPSAAAGAASQKGDEQASKADVPKEGVPATSPGSEATAPEKSQPPKEPEGSEKRSQSDEKSPQPDQPKPTGQPNEKPMSESPASSAGKGEGERGEQDQGLKGNAGQKGEAETKGPEQQGNETPSPSGESGKDSGKQAGEAKGDSKSEGQSVSSGSPQAGEGSSSQSGSADSTSDGKKSDPTQPPFGEVGLGSAITGNGGREGGVSDSLPNGTQPADEWSAPELPEEGGQQVGSVGRLDRLVGTLERELRAGTVDPSLLQELGWDLPRARQFVEDYRRTRQGGQSQVRQTALAVEKRSTTQNSSGAVVLQGTTAANSARAFQSDAPHRADEMQGAADRARQRVPARYRTLLDAYYRTISSQPAK